MVANGDGKARQRSEYFPELSTVDNKNAIIIFDTSQTGSTKDCLMPSRSEREGYWRRLPSSVVYEMRLPSNATDKQLTLACAHFF